MNRPGRLFWRFLLGFWLAMIAVGVLMAAVFYLLRWMDMAPIHPGVSQRAAHRVETTATLLDLGRADAARELLLAWQREGAGPVVYVVSADGHDLLNRTLPADLADAAARRAVITGSDSPFHRRVALKDAAAGSVWVFASEADLQTLAPPKAGSGGPPLALPVLVAGLVGLLFSAGLAWTVVKPIRSLRWALHEVAEGHLAARVGPLMGQRRDELADLGQDFDRMADRLEQLIGAQQRLLHDVSHELRSPLARMRTAIDLMRQQPARATAMLERIERESERLDKLVGELLVLARLESGATVLRRERTDVIELVSSIVQDAQFEARAAGRDVLLRAEGDFMAEVAPEALCRAFENVVRNGVRHTCPGSTVEVDVVVEPAGLRVTVHDRGPGVPERLFASMFQPFERLGEGWSEGAGLGLAIARRALVLHGGTITPSQRPGGGLSMQIFLPSEVR